MNALTAPGNVVVITVELFGMARIHAGVSSVTLRVGARTPLPALVDALARECPALVGNALHRAEDGAVAVADGYALNRNGLAFLSPDTDAVWPWQEGDSILLLSNQAGG